MIFAHLRRHDWLLNGSIVFLAGASLLILWSISGELFYRQAGWFAAGAVVLFATSLIDWRPFLTYRWAMFALYAGTLLLLVATLLFAPTIRNTKSWLVIGTLRVQTSEFAKVALIIILAYFFARRHFGMARAANIFQSFIYFFLPTLLVLMQPDWGTAFIFLGVWVGFLFMSGVRPRHLAIGCCLLIVFGVLSWTSFLAPYQKERIVGFFQPSYDPLGVNYSVIQSRIAIGSGGLWGKGFGQGTQLQLGFLTEPATDFVFAAFVEEWGLAGGLFLIGSFGFLIVRIIRIGLRAPNNFSRFLCLGSALVFVLHFFLNVGSNLGLVPVVGVPFPFVSYGGSSILTKAILIGIIQSNSLRARSA